MLLHLVEPAHHAFALVAFALRDAEILAKLGPVRRRDAANFERGHLGLGTLRDLEDGVDLPLGLVARGADLDPRQKEAAVAQIFQDRSSRRFQLLGGEPLADGQRNHLPGRAPTETRVAGHVERVEIVVGEQPEFDPHAPLLVDGADRHLGEASRVVERLDRVLDGRPSERVAGPEAEEGVVVRPVDGTVGGEIDAPNDSPEVLRRLPLLACPGQSRVRGAEKQERGDSTAEQTHTVIFSWGSAPPRLPRRSHSCARYAVRPHPGSVARSAHRPRLRSGQARASARAVTRPQRILRACHASVSTPSHSEHHVEQAVGNEEQGYTQEHTQGDGDSRLFVHLRDEVRSRDVDRDARAEWKRRGD
jgi:hypothetical protein